MKRSRIANLAVVVLTLLLTTGFLHFFSWNVKKIRLASTRPAVVVHRFAQVSGAVKAAKRHTERSKARPKERAKEQPAPEKPEPAPEPRAKDRLAQRPPRGIGIKRPAKRRKARRRPPRVDQRRLRRGYRAAAAKFIAGGGDIKGLLAKIDGETDTTAGYLKWAKSFNIRFILVKPSLRGFHGEVVFGEFEDKYIPLKRLEQKQYSAYKRLVTNGELLARARALAKRNNLPPNRSLLGLSFKRDDRYLVGKILRSLKENNIEMKQVEKIKVRYTAKGRRPIMLIQQIVLASGEVVMFKDPEA